MKNAIEILNEVINELETHNDQGIDLQIKRINYAINCIEDERMRLKRVDEIIEDQESRT